MGYVGEDANMSLYIVETSVDVLADRLTKRH
jgi:hypothetical protein